MAFLSAIDNLYMVARRFQVMGDSSLVAASEGPFLHALWAAVARAGCRYAVMRNYEKLPATVAGSDLDLLVDPCDEPRVLSVLDEVVVSQRAVIVGHTRSPGFHKLAILGVNPGNNWWGLRIDLNVGLQYKGIPLLKEDFSSGTVDHAGLVVLNPGLAAVLGVLKEVLNNALLPRRYVEAARVGIAGSGEERIRDLLGPMGERAIAKLFALIRTGTPGPCVRAAVALRAQLAMNSVRQRSLQCIRDRFAFEASKVHRILCPAGSVIAVLGVDGVGKSTVISGVKNILAQATHGACQVRHLRPGLLPPLSRLALRSQRGVSVQNVAPHGSQPSGTMGSLIRVTWLLADYVGGYWLKIRPFISKQPAVVIYDRYAYDLVIDPRRFRVSSLPFLGWTVGLIVPKPDLIFCLFADLNTIRERKEELPSAEVLRQTGVLQRFAADEPRAISVSTEGTVTEVQNEVLSRLYEYLKARNLRCADGV